MNNFQSLKQCMHVACQCSIQCISRIPDLKIVLCYNNASRYRIYPYLFPWVSILDDENNFEAIISVWIPVPHILIVDLSVDYTFPETDCSARLFSPEGGIELTTGNYNVSHWEDLVRFPLIEPIIQWVYLLSFAFTERKKRKKPSSNSKWNEIGV